MITLQKFSILTCIFIEIRLSDCNQQQQLFISRDNLMFPTIKGLHLSHLGNCDKSACTQFSVSICVLLKYVNAIKYCCLYIRLFLHLQDELSSSLWKPSLYLNFGSCDHAAEIQNSDLYFD